MESGVCLQGTEVVAVGGLLSVLAGAVAALWYAYSQGVERRLEAETRANRELRVLATDALQLILAVATRASGPVVNDQDRQQIAALQQRMRAPKEDP